MYTDDNDGIPKDINKVRETARKKAIELAVNRYFAGIKGARNKRYFWNDGKKKISEEFYRKLIALNKNELSKTLSGLLRKGDTITAAPPG